jgi:uncharacterized sporulation protein YeaH/YhbH (DUF444 family)
MSTIMPGDADWGGHGSLDQARHAEKLQQAIRERLPAIIGHTPIITQDPRQPVRVTVPYLRVPTFEPAGDDSEAAGGIGQGSARPGDVVGRRPRPGIGRGAAPGEEPGEHVVVELDLATLLAWVFEDLHLPRLQQREPPRMAETAPVWRTRRRHGPLSTLAVRHTLKAAMARSLAEGAELHFTPDDLRFRAAEDDPVPSTNAVIYLLRDISGSMAGDRTYLSRVLAWWIVAWLRWQYRHVVLEWWVHDADVQRVASEAEFFGMESAGGTLAAPAYVAVKAHADLHYPPGAWNRYLLHLTDGQVADAREAASAAQDLAATVNALWLVEIQPWQMPGWDRWQLGSTLEAALPDPPFRRARMRDRGDVARILRVLLGDAA